MRRVAAWLVACILALAAGCVQEPPARQAGGSSNPSLLGPAFGFYNEDRLMEHYSKHGREFGEITPDEYLARARSLRDAPVGGDVLQIIRGDTVRTRFDRGKGDFIAFDRDLTIRTFFRPNDGERYFRRQATRPR